MNTSDRFACKSRNTKIAHHVTCACASISCAYVRTYVWADHVTRSIWSSPLWAHLTPSFAKARKKASRIEIESPPFESTRGQHLFSESCSFTVTKPPQVSVLFDLFSESPPLLLSAFLSLWLVLLLAVSVGSLM